MYGIDSLVEKSSLIRISVKPKLVNGKAYIDAGESIWTPYDSVVVSIKLKRVTNSISAEYFPKNTNGNNWQHNRYQFIIEEFPYEDIEYVEIYIIWKYSFSNIIN